MEGRREEREEWKEEGRRGREEWKEGKRRGREEWKEGERRGRSRRKEGGEGREDGVEEKGRYRYSREGEWELVVGVVGGGERERGMNREREEEGTSTT